MTYAGGGTGPDLRGEAMRYLGMRAPDPRVDAYLDAALQAIGAVSPQHVLVAVTLQEALALFGSRQLADYLAGCEGAMLLAATLGTPVDRMIRRAEAIDTPYAAVLHACASAAIQAHCDALQARIPQACRPRFSPGYGDFPLSMQRALLARTAASKRIGLYLTDACMLVPAKSMTAVLGLGPARGGMDGHKCARCDKTDCAYRKEGTL